MRHQRGRNGTTRVTGKDSPSCSAIMPGFQDILDSPTEYTSFYALFFGA